MRCEEKKHYLLQHSFIAILFIFIPLNAMSSQFIVMYMELRDADTDADADIK